MSPKTPKTKRGELPKPIIRPGSLGLLPFSPLAVSYLHGGHGDLILGYHDDNETLALKNRSAITVLDGNGKEQFMLDGRFFNGYSDALYRGKLPEVIIAAPAPQELGTYLDDLVEYLEKMLSLGFFLPKKELIKRDPVQDFVPCTVLTGGGLLFSRFITGLMHALKSFENQHPVMDEAIRLRIVGRFVRGLPGTEPTEIPETGEARTGQIRIEPVPCHIRIGGGSRHTQDVIQTVFSKHGLIASFENRARNPVERLELENALWRLSTVILPTLVDQKTLKAAELKKLTPRIENGILSIGRCRQAFDETDSPESIRSSNGKKTGASKPDGKQALREEDALLLGNLVQYAEGLGLNEEQALFAQLAEQLSAGL